MAVPTAESVLEAALQLSQAERAKVAADLLESLPPPPVYTDESIDGLLARRIAEIDSGRVTMIPWEEVRKELRHESGVIPSSFIPKPGWRLMTLATGIP
jgi:putative addiction module component (TIGR02574 family)